MRTLFITNGYSKDHRPDLEQFLFVWTTSADGAFPCSSAARPTMST